jgi:pantoate--beta-alanine ligase
LDYAEIIDERDFTTAVDETENKRAIFAGWLNGVRLIDNMQMKLGASR